MADNNQSTEWYLARDGQQHGPVTEVELRKIIELGYLRPTDLVWREGMAEWALAETVLDLAPRAAPAPPAPVSAVQRSSAAPASPSAPQGRSPSAPHRPDGLSQQVAGAPGADAHLQSRDRGRYPAAAPVVQPAPSRPGPDPHRSAASPREPLIESAAHERRRFPWGLAIVLVLLAGLAAGGFFLYKSGKLQSLPFLAAPGATDAVPVVSGPKGPDRDAAPASLAATTAPSGGPAQPESAASSVDGRLQRSPLWQRLKRDFPDWYAERLDEIKRLAGESKTDGEISATMLRSVVELRRKHHADALAAGPARLKSIASSFVDNLTLLSRESTAACYGYISQGEASPLIRPEQRPVLDAQLAVVFDAVVEGRKSPVRREPPKREDYDVLTGELAKRGWSAADLQLFTDARALARAAPEKVCQMVQDWFAAQLAVQDEAAKIRLLGEALKPVVAG